MKVGVTLPSFRDDAGALAAAAEAEALGLDGVFVFDHLWPLGQPGRPALAMLPLLGAVAAVTSRVVLGPLVARVGLVAEGVLTRSLRSVAGIAPGRVVAGLGTGDAKSAPEQAAYGLAYPPAAERRAELRRCAGQLMEAGIPVWVGGGRSATTAIAVEVGAAVAVWDAPLEQVRSVGGDSPVVWGGRVASGREAQAAWLGACQEAGAAWVVATWPGDLVAWAEAAAEVRRVGSERRGDGACG